MIKDLSKRQFKKGLRKLEVDIGETLNNHREDLSSLEFIGKLDFWVSYYVTWLFRATNLPKEMWCDGSKWVEDHHVMEFVVLSDSQYSLKCQLDVQDDSSSYEGDFEITFEFDRGFSKFSNYSARLYVENNEYSFSPEESKKFNE